VEQDGAWVPVSTTLERRSDGSVAPKATVTGIVFPGGDAGPMASLRAPTGFRSCPEAAAPVEVLQSCAPAGNAWNSTGLNWENKPCEGALQDTRDSNETSSGVSLGTLSFNVT
jgi:hypothetical protein